MYPDNNNNNNKIKSIKVKTKIKKMGGARESGKRIIFIFFLFFHLFFRFKKIRLQVFVGVEGKVDLRDESYAWTLKSWSFNKLHEVENFPTCVISSLNDI